MTVSSVDPIFLRQGLEEPLPEVVDAARDQDDCFTNIEVADFPTAIESPSVPCFGGEAHLASLGHPDVACALHGHSIQGTR